MNYFREKLLTYSTQRQVSTLLHIYVQTDKAKPIFPPSKAKNYVDEILHEYTVKMCNYPDLNASDSKLALNIYNQKKISSNIFHLEQFKRKPLKKKISKRSISSAFPAQNYKICPCCEIKVFSKHKCDHTLCQKPCARTKRFKLVSNNQQATQWKKRILDQQQQFSPDKDQLDNDQSKYSNSNDRESDFSEELQNQQLQQSQSFLSNLDKSRKGKNRRKIRKDQPNTKKSRRTRNHHHRRFRSQVKKQQQIKQQIIEGEKITLNLDDKKNEILVQPNQHGNQQIKIQVQNKQQIKKSPTKRRKPIANKQSKKVSTPSENIQSQFQPQDQSPKKDGRRKKGFGKKLNIQNEQKLTDNNSQIFKFKKKQSLTYFGSLEQLKNYQLINFHFHFDAEALQPINLLTNSAPNLRQEIDKKEKINRVLSDRQQRKQQNIIVTTKNQNYQKNIMSQQPQQYQIQFNQQINNITQNEVFQNIEKNKEDVQGLPVNSNLDQIFDEDGQKLFSQNNQDIVE